MYKIIFHFGTQENKKKRGRPKGSKTCIKKDTIHIPVIDKKTICKNVKSLLNDGHELFLGCMLIHYPTLLADVRHLHGFYNWPAFVASLGLHYAEIINIYYKHLSVITLREKHVKVKSMKVDKKYTTFNYLTNDDKKPPYEDVFYDNNFYPQIIRKEQAHVHYPKNVDAIELYIREVRSLPTLTKPEGLTLFREMRWYDFKMEQAFNEGNYDLALRFKEQQKEARDFIVKSTQRMVLFIALQECRKVPEYILSYEAAICEGNMALMQSIERFNYKLGYAFSSFSGSRIRGAIKDFVRKQYSYVNTLSSYYMKKLRKINKEIFGFEQEEQRSISNQEISKRFNIPLADINYLMSSQRTSLSFETSEVTDMNGNSIYLKHTLEDIRNRTPEVETTSKLFSIEFDKILRRLEPREEFVMRFCFGIGEGFEPLELNEIGRLMNLTQSRITHILQDTKEQLRVFLMNNRMGGYFDWMDS
ncbi:sigma-70 family RNA polymerase sigma factor [Candidatus Margulisiibacteriota bacterium]